MSEDTPLTNEVARKWIKEQPMVPSDQQAVTLLIKTLFNHARDMERKANAATARVVELEAQITEMDIAMSNLKFFAGKYLDMVDAKMEKKEVAHERD